MGVWSSFKHAFNTVTHTIGKAFSSIASEISSDSHAVASTIKSAATTVYSDVKGGAKTIYTSGQDLTKTVFSGVKGTLDNTINKTTGILSLPLIILAVGVGIFAFNSRGDFRASYNK